MQDRKMQRIHSNNYNLSALGIIPCGIKPISYIKFNENTLHITTQYICEALFSLWDEWGVIMGVTVAVDSLLEHHNSHKVQLHLKNWKVIKVYTLITFQ